MSMGQESPIEESRSNDTYESVVSQRFMFVMNRLSGGDSFRANRLRRPGSIRVSTRRSRSPLRGLRLW